MSYKFCYLCGRLFNEEGQVDPLTLLLPNVYRLSQASAQTKHDKRGTTITLPMSGLKVEIVYPKSFTGGEE